MRIILVMLVGALGGSATGCRWVDKVNAEHHDKRAKEEARSLNFGAALDEHEKANEANKAAKKDPLP